MNVREFVAYAVVMLVIDLIWISAVMGRSYKTVFSNLFKVNYLSGAIAYMILVLTYVPVHYGSANLRQKLVRAAMIGFSIYGTYAFTVKAFLPMYPAWLALVESLWGVALLTLTTAFTHLLA